jgi:hypothetical protein
MITVECRHRKKPVGQTRFQAKLLFFKPPVAKTCISSNPSHTNMHVFSPQTRNPAVVLSQLYKPALSQPPDTRTLLSSLQVGDVLDVKLIEINERGQLRLSHRAVLLENEKGTSPKPGAPASSPGPGGVNEPVRAAVRPVPKGVWQRPGPSTGAGNGSGGAQVREQG